MRYYTTLLAFVAAPLLVSARPIRTRAASAKDTTVLQFANVLEQLETKFYAQGIAKFQDADFQGAGFSASQIPIQILTTIQLDESTHTTVLQQTLQDNGATPLQCDFNFDSVLTDVATMAATARVVEMVGVAAYLGGATLVDDPILLDAAASILTVEARHSTLLNVLSGTGSAIPQAFDIALTPQEVLSIAGGFIQPGCDLGLTPTNTLTLTNTGSVSQGTLLTFSGNGVNSTDGLFCNMITGGMPFSLNLPLANCVVPPGINGPVAIWITSDNNPLVNNVVDRDTTKQVAGPLIAFIDSQPEMLGQLVRGSGTNSGATSTTTTTITPDQAASIIAGASATASGASSTATDSSSDSGDAGSNGAASPPASTPLPPDFTGQSPDGKVDVIGLSMVPRPTDSASASDSAASSSPTDSAGSSSPTDSAASSSATDSAPSASATSS